MFGSKFHYWKSDKNQKWYWHLRAENGEIICQSQGYVSEQGCKRGIRAVRWNALFAGLVKS